ncbi:MAG TPA: plastocyanin/azurin family copper-binding protein [Euzebyales bacterium]
MGRPLRIILTVVTGLLLAGCLSSEPKIAEVEQVAAVQREAMQATESAEGGDEGGGGEGGGSPATWVAIDIEYADAPQEVPAGPVEVEFDNQGAIEHNVVIEELGDEKILEAPGGGTDSATVEFEAGEYTYYCDVPGHRATMEGALTVSG